MVTGRVVCDLTVGFVMKRATFLNRLIDHLSPGEYAEICQMFGIDADFFLGSELSRYVQLIEYVESHNQVDQLINWINENRPDINLDGFSAETLTLDEPGGFQTIRDGYVTSHT
ncbi:MAG: hypothetical protein AAGD96_35160, partial [Chloroflexota bacterium]